MKDKSMEAEAVSIIGGADGPTSIFIAERSDKKAKKLFKECIRQGIYQYRRKKIEKKIHADPHTLKKVIAYAKKKYHAAEIPKTKRMYTEQYASVKEGLVFQYKPELLGELREIKRPDVLNKETAEEIYRQCQLRSEKAASIPDSEMPMDFHLYEIRTEGGRMDIAADFKWDIFSVSYSGNRKSMKKLRKAARELYLYYGVSEDDIQYKTRRYSALLTALCSK